MATVVPLVLAPLLAPRNGVGTSDVLGALIVVAYTGHIAVTGWLGTVPDVQRTVRARPGRLVVLPVALVVGAMAMTTAAPAHLVEVLLLGFFAWQFSHFQGQNLGLAKVVASRWEAAPLSTADYRRVAVAGWCAIAALVARPPFLGLHDVVVPATPAHLLVRVATLAYASCVIAAVVAVLRARRPAPVTAAYLGSVAFVAPVFLFHRPAAAVSGMVIAHGLQYLWVVRARARTARVNGSKPVWPATAAVLGLALVGGALLAALSQLYATDHRLLRTAYGAYLGLVMAHFAVDPLLWRRPAPVRPAGGTVLPPSAGSRTTGRTRTAATRPGSGLGIEPTPCRTT